MLKKSFNQYIIVFILVLGVIYRLTLFSVSPPSNSHDNHREVISLYAKSFERPEPFQCWECYQPPAYYVIGAAVYNTAKFFKANNLIAWKIVQFINPVLSILVLIMIYKIILKVNISDQNKILYMSFIAVLPRDIFTSSMIGNDYLLAFSAVAALYYYLKNIDFLKTNEKISIKYFIYLSLFVILGSLSKQHGLILLIFPAYIVWILLREGRKKVLAIIIPVLIGITIISLSEEIWKYNKTGKILVSNQDYFDSAKGQFPGSLDKVEFGTFRIFSLFKDPFISKKTAASFFTEIFARTFFDYEWRFLSPKIPAANRVGRFAYGLGILWMIYFILISFLWIKGNYKKVFRLNLYRSALLVPLFAGLLFMMVPLIQTIRFPYYSSMKSMFMLPGLIILIALHAFAAGEIKFQIKGFNILTCLNILYGFVLMIYIYNYIEISLEHLYQILSQ